MLVMIGLLLMVVCTVSDGHIGPQILSQPSMFRSHIGDDVILPCNVTKLSDVVLLWKQGSRIIFAGDIKVRRDDRFALDGTNLHIYHLSEKDDGEYTCELETKDKHNPKWITHKVLVLQKPQIVTSSSHANLTVIRGSSVVLNCGATGNPRPSIVWNKRNRDMAGLEHTISDNGSSLYLHNITTAHAGSYTCTADNGVGNPVTEEVLLTVLYPPVARAEIQTVLGGEGCLVDVVCQVEGFPWPTVHWYQGTMKLVPTNNIRVSNIGTRYQLSFIRFSFHDGDSLELSCVASSSLGSSEANFIIIGTSGTPVVSPNVTEVEVGKYLMEWTTPSFAEIVEHALVYKQVKDDQSLLTYGETKLKIPNMGVQKRDCSSRNVPFKHKFSFVLDKLEPVTKYQVRISARNQHGWSDISEPIVFKTSQFLVHPPQESPMLPLSGANIIFEETTFSLNLMMLTLSLFYVCAINIF